MSSQKKENAALPKNAPQEQTPEPREKLHISVRGLVEFIFREGDIDNRSSGRQSPDAMLEGSRIHRKIQKSKGAGYQAEVPLSYLDVTDLYELTIEGRADGIFCEDGQWWIDEIKGVYRPLEHMEAPVYVHQAQAMCYAYIYALMHSLSSIGVMMTYCNMESEEKKYFRESFPFAEIEAWFQTLLADYRKWADFMCERHRIRQASIRGLNFPYPYRKGQQQLVTDVYRTILRKKTLFLQAPTGVGKTISTIYPAVMAVGQGLGDRIFYLTAKTITATVAKQTFHLLREQGYRALIIQITAKEKLCLCEEMDCNPVNCPYAKGHYDRINDALYALLHASELFSREEILAQAKASMVCPFELSLDAATFADDIICDYNYLYDPNVCLKRFFQEGTREDYIFLVDEAHNLVERSRQMYSAELCKEEVLSVRRILKGHSRKLEKLLTSVNQKLLELKRRCEDILILEDLGGMHVTLLRLLSEMDEWLQKPIELPERKEVLDFYFALRRFLAVADLFDEHYVLYAQINEEGNFVVKEFCVDPSRNLQDCTDKGRATVFFSATLLPIGYYKSLLSDSEDDYAIYAQSSFDPARQLILLGRDVSTRYTQRNEQQFARIAGYLWEMVRARQGNYMAFFPSYQLMEQVYEQFVGMGADCDTIQQSARMKEAEREEFLREFEQKRERSLLAFCVMGGIFGEGIDLTGERLIGAAIVGTGLPQISKERGILRDYFEERIGEGFDYAYRFPGMNKVLQSAGRVRIAA